MDNRNFLKILSFLIMIICFCTSIAFAEQYFVKPDGNDSLDGLSDETAWRTTNKVNSFRFSTGDDVYFKSNGVWKNQQLIVDWSGTDGNRVTIGAYYFSNGEENIGVKGSKPVFDGNDVAPGPAPCECGGCLSGLVETKQDYINFENLEIINVAGRGILSAYNRQVGVYSCVTENTWNSGITFFDVDGFAAEGNKVSYAAQIKSVCNNGPAAIHTVRASNGKIKNNIVFSNRMEGIGTYKGSNNIVVEGNTSYDQRVDIYVGKSSDITVRWNLVYNSSKRQDGVGIGVTHERRVEYYPFKNNSVYGNIIAAKKLALWIGIQNDITVGSNMRVYNNTIVECEMAVNQHGMFENSYFKNNVIYSPSGNCKMWQGDQNGWSLSNNAWEYKGAWSGPGDIITDSNFQKTSGWKSLIAGKFDGKGATPTSGTNLSNSGAKLPDPYRTLLLGNATDFSILPQKISTDLNSSSSPHIGAILPHDDTQNAYIPAPTLRLLDIDVSSTVN